MAARSGWSDFQLDCVNPRDPARQLAFWRDAARKREEEWAKAGLYVLDALGSTRLTMRREGRRG